MKLSLEIKTRWDSSLLNETNKTFAQSAKGWNGNRSLPLSPFKETEKGMHDYRGFRLTVQLVRLNIKNSDFSGMVCEQGGSLNDCIVEDSVLRSSNFDGRFFGKQFLRCDLTGVSIKNGAIGNSVFTECDFSGANLTNAMARGAKFTRCSFDQANMKRAILLHCIFDNCSFEGTKFHNGSIVGCKFIANSPSDEQLGNTIVTNDRGQITITRE
jgi:uncharacterized protein YjbI with pentapeptide repeats